jgi:hypothetical protein
VKRSCGARDDSELEGLGGRICCGLVCFTGSILDTSLRRLESVWMGPPDSGCVIVSPLEAGKCDMPGC